MNDIKMPISQVRELLTGGGRELAREKTEGEKDWRPESSILTGSFCKHSLKLSEKPKRSILKLAATCSGRDTLVYEALCFQ